MLMFSNVAAIFVGGFKTPPTVGHYAYLLCETRVTKYAAWTNQFMMLFSYSIQ